MRGRRASKGGYIPCPQKEKCLWTGLLSRKCLKWLKIPYLRIHSPTLQMLPCPHPRYAPEGVKKDKTYQWPTESKMFVFNITHITRKSHSNNYDIYKKNCNWILTFAINAVDDCNQHRYQYSHTHDGSLLRHHSLNAALENKTPILLWMSYTNEFKFTYNPKFLD